MSKYLMIEGKFITFYMNGSNLGIHYDEPYLMYRLRKWYKPWTWFKDPDIILPEPSQIVLELDKDNNIKFVIINDAMTELGKKKNLLLTENELHELRGR